MCKKAAITDQILELLSEDDKWAFEIVAGVSAQPVSIRMCLCELVKKDKSEKRGVRGAVENVRKHSNNVATINELLNFYDQVLDDISITIKTEDWTAVETRVDVIKSLRWLAGVIDQLMAISVSISAAIGPLTRH